jgi:hypothetical protein
MRGAYTCSRSTAAHNASMGLSVCFCLLLPPARHPLFARLLTIAQQLDADCIHADYAVNARAYAHSVTRQWTTGKACGILMMILGHGDTIIINRLNGNSAQKSAKSWFAASAKQCLTAWCSAISNTVSQMFFNLFTQMLGSRTLSEPLLKNPSASASACTESFKNCKTVACYNTPLLPDSKCLGNVSQRLPRRKHSLEARQCHCENKQKPNTRRPDNDEA